MSDHKRRVTRSAAVAAHPVPKIYPGVTLAIPEADYCYGVGVLLLRVTQIGIGQDQLPTLEWVMLRGVQLNDLGADCGTREVVVRVSALADALRPTGWLPARDAG